MKPWEKDDTMLAKWLSGELSDEERMAFEQTEEYHEFVSAANALEQFETPSYDVGSELTRLKGSISEKEEEGEVSQGKQIFLPRWVYAAAASVLLVLGVVWWQFSAGSTTEIVALENQHHDFPDGSYVEIRANSEVAYSPENWKEDRTIQLSGEAFFSVEKGAKFEVQLAKGTVTVLGTSFNIHEEENSLAVTCYSGKVQVVSYGGTKILNPGQQYLFRSDDTPLQINTTQEKPGWMRKVTALESVSLREALTELQVNYHFQIVGDVAEGEKFNCVYPTDDLETALKQVLGPFGIEYTISDDKKTVTLE